ncbi:MAG TPA: glucose-6-phosphate dehydrogenase assembly protein OpcA, partial [Pyrinomonadaceae bacterium]|nr:glucose-6-phosphate dehydrogenase assembly protein OpcA [Pyrinomonadaceae bacterium]
MKQSTRTTHQQIHVPATLDVQSVERELSELWRVQNAEGRADDNESALIRARVLNLMIYVAAEDALDEINEALAEISSTHPCRALVMCADSAGADEDIEMFVSAFCQDMEDDAPERQLCCEQVSLVARGRFAVELPSAAVPLLVSDLPTFLYWHDRQHFTDESFKRLSHAADRVVIDSAMFDKPHRDVRALSAFMEKEVDESAAVSDLNWARLTAWRALLAGFFDAPESRANLERINRVLVEYVSHESAPEEIAPQ